MNDPTPRRNLVSLEGHATASVVATWTSARRASDAGMIPPVAPTLAVRRGDSRLNDRSRREAADSGPGPALAAAILGFFIVTLDAVVVNVALPSIRHDLGGGITGLQWVVDGYTLTFAALLLSTGASRLLTRPQPR